MVQNVIQFLYLTHQMCAPIAAPIVRRTIRMPGGGNHTVSAANLLNKRALAMGVTDTTLQSARSDLSTYTSGQLDDSISPRGVTERASSLVRTHTPVGMWPDFFHVNITIQTCLTPIDLPAFLMNLSVLLSYFSVVHSVRAVNR